MPRLLLLTQYFPPEMGAPQARLSELGARLVARGWDVEVLTALPNYPTGKVFDGYGPLRVVEETIAGLRTVRLPLYASSQGFARRMLTYLSFAGAAAALGPGRVRRPDLVFVESPPLFLGLGALALCRRLGCRYVFNVSDLWPESAVRMGIVGERALATRAAERLELYLYRHAAGVTGQSEDIIASVTRRAPGVPTAVITNGVNPDRFGDELADDEARLFLGAGAGALFLFAGLIGHAQGCGQILDLAADLPPGTARFALVGDGPERAALDARVRREGLASVSLPGAVPRERVPALLAAADVALITLGLDIPGAVPSKIYEAMAAGRPILLVASGEAARRVLDAGAGLVVQPNDRAGLVAAARRLAGDAALRARLGAAGRVAARERYSRDAIAGRLNAFLRERLSLTV